MIFPRRTVSADVRVRGDALHGGHPADVRVHPAEDGLWFRYGAYRVEAIPANVTDTNRRTKLGSINTIEHLMSALAMLGITDADIEVSGDELPAADGCALPYITALQSVLVDLPSRERPDLFARIWEKSDSSEIAIAAGDGHWRYEFVGPEGRFPGHQVFECMLSRESCTNEIAPARTTAFDFEVEMARAAGLGLGLTEESCLVLGPEGYVNPARFPDEPARHKLLDLIGDLWLARVPITMLNVDASRSGHTANVAAAARLAQAVPLT
ncbi:MAG: UDP-3-O-acyl-N-acetylglucosamine deacetylase [Chthonomonas sp.]|nr:UDP-3-O-acyl-N-acetylglucosamine deacetylase [Chthonomonas sp.]